MEKSPQHLPPLCWRRDDIEQRVGFRGGRFTRVNGIFSCLAAMAFAITFYVIVYLVSDSPFTDMFTKRGMVPYFIVFLGSWALVILFIKSSKLRLQRRALSVSVIPESTDFVLSVKTVDDVFDRIHEQVDEPRFFVLFNRIHVALSNLRNLGRIPDVDEILRSQAEHDESTMETSYSLCRGFVWAIPVLGFIGTVLGLSQAIGGFGQVLATAKDVAELSGSLTVVTSGLATAFETTLIALVIALGVHIAMTFLKKSEEEFLDDCSDYCQHQIVNRLRIMPFDQDQDES